MKNRGLTPEEQALWRRAVRDVQRMRRQAEDTLPDSDKTGLRSSEKLSPEKRAGDVLPRKTTTRPRAVPDPFVAGDPRADRKVARGRMPIEAVLDLHGHTQATARKTLLAFLINARLSDKRCVLVITGKGVGAARASGGQALGGGVLRARLSDWLKEEPFRELVVRASPAHRKHGGGGAFYVFLRSRTRKKS
ncbi:MAG: Smr/MutS family protein [Pseudomonadota bacterium]